MRHFNYTSVRHSYNSKPVFLLACLLFLLGLITPSFSQNKNRALFYIDTTVTIMQKNSVNYKKLEDIYNDTAFIRSRNQSITTGQIGNTIRYLYKLTNDFHGAFFDGDSVYRYTHNEPFVNDSIRKELKKGVRIKTVVLPNQIGYLRIPSMPVTNASQFNIWAQKLNDSLNKLLIAGVKSIIIDLRLNGGGTMQSMILGLSPLLSDGVKGHFVLNNGKENWTLKKDIFYTDTSFKTQIKNTVTKKYKKLPVVFITGKITGSAAENLIIGFKGRKNTLFIGDTTAGFITVNNGFLLNDNTGFNLSVGYCSDGNGKLYTHSIPPDVYLNCTDNFTDITQDEKIKYAITRLSKNLKKIKSSAYNRILPL